MKEYFKSNLVKTGSRPGYAHTWHYFKAVNPNQFYQDFLNRVFSEKDLIDYADGYYYNFGGQLSWHSLGVDVKVYTD